MSGVRFSSITLATSTLLTLFASVGFAAPCPPDSAGASRAGSVQRSSHTIVNAILQVTPAEKSARAELRNVIGVCAFNPPSMPVSGLKTAQYNEPRPYGTSIYDAIARPASVSAMRRHAPKIRSAVVRQDGKRRPITADDFIDIDLIARTLFGEIRNSACTDGNYLPLITRLLLNRSSNSNSSLFQRKVGPDARTPIQKAILSNRQFAVWNNDNELGSSLASERQNTRLILCPSATPSNPGDQEIWNSIMTVAIHAVLDRDQFLSETASLDHLLYYTSGVAAGAGYVAISPKFNGKIYKPALSGSKCKTTFWKTTK